MEMRFPAVIHPQSKLRIALIALSLVCVGATSFDTSAIAGARIKKKVKKPGTTKPKSKSIRPNLPQANKPDLLPSPQQRAATTGFFTTAPAAKIKQVEKQYLADKTRSGGLVSIPAGTVRKVGSKDLHHNLERSTKKQLSATRNAGFKALKGSSKFAKELAGTGYSAFSTLHYFTSGAGLWSRGGGQVKAQIPLNIAEVLSVRDSRLLEQAGDIVAAKTPIAARAKAGVLGTGKSDSQIISDARGTISRLVKLASSDLRAINVLDLKLVNIALLSEKSNSYVHFDIWTSSQTHEAIRSYLSGFKANYKKRVFHADKKSNAQIHSALEKYFAASAKLGETHLFGYQRGLHALDVETGKSISSSVAIGEGAGMAKTYLNESGRAAALSARGVKHWVFQNIEVISDVALEFGAHKAAKSPVSVVVVPTKEGYSGGSPYRVQNDGKVSYQLLEASAVPNSMASGNAYFNTNTIYQRASLAPITKIGYELKDNGRVVRLKMNAGDVTLSNSTSLIGGRIGKEYENFKTYGEFRENGLGLVGAVQQSWTQGYLH